MTTSGMTQSGRQKMPMLRRTSLKFIQIRRLCRSRWQEESTHYHREDPSCINDERPRSSRVARSDRLNKGFGPSERRACPHINQLSQFSCTVMDSRCEKLFLAIIERGARSARDDVEMRSMCSFGISGGRTDLYASPQATLRCRSG